MRLEAGRGRVVSKQLSIGRLIPLLVTILLLAALPTFLKAQSFSTVLSDANRAVRTGEYARAEKLLRSVLADANTVNLGDDRVLTVLDGLGYVLRMQRKFADAEEVFVRALSVHEARGTTVDLGYARVLRALGQVHEQSGQLEKAERHYWRAVAAFEASGQSKQPSSALALSSLGSLYMRRGQYAGADTIYARAIEILELSPTLRRQQLATVVNNRAVAVENVGNYEEARSLYQRAIQLRQEEWGAKDPRLATALANLATLYRRREDYAVAESLYVRALAIYDDLPEPPVGKLLPLLINLGMNYERLIVSGKAIATYERAVTLIEDYGVADDRLYALVGSALGWLYYAEKRYGEAEPFLINTADALMRLHGEDYEGLATIFGRYATVLSETGRPEEARLARNRARRLQGLPEIDAPVDRDSRVSDPPALEPREAEAPPENVTVAPETGRIYRLDGSDGERSMLTRAPRYISCPRYDPKERAARQRVDDRYEGQIRFERMPQQVDALLELVIGVGGQVERKLSTILRTSDFRANRILLQWVESCRFTPGAIGDKAVRVRIEFPLKLEFVNN